MTTAEALSLLGQLAVCGLLGIALIVAVFLVTEYIVGDGYDYTPDND